MKITGKIEAPLATLASIEFYYDLHSNTTVEGHQHPVEVHLDVFCVTRFPLVEGEDTDTSSKFSKINFKVYNHIVQTIS